MLAKSIRLVGICFLLLAAYITYESVLDDQGDTGQNAPFIQLAAVHFCVTRPSKAFQPMVKYCGPVGLPNTAFRSKMAVSTIPSVYNPAVPPLLSKSRESRQIYGSSRSMLSSPGMTFTTGPFQKTGVGPSLHFDRGAYRIASSQ